MKNNLFNKIKYTGCALGAAAVMALSGCGDITAKTGSKIEFNERDFGRDKFNLDGVMYQLNMTMVEPEEFTDSLGRQAYRAPEGAFMFDNGRCYKFVFEKLTEEQYEERKEEGILIGFDSHREKDGTVIETYKYAPIRKTVPYSFSEIEKVNGKEITTIKSGYRTDYVAPSFCTRVESFGGDLECYVDIVYSKDLQNTQSDVMQLNR